MLFASGRCYLFNTGNWTQRLQIKQYLGPYKQFWITVNKLQHYTHGTYVLQIHYFVKNLRACSTILIRVSQTNPPCLICSTYWFQQKSFGWLVRLTCSVVLKKLQKDRYLAILLIHMTCTELVDTLCKKCMNQVMYCQGDCTTHFLPLLNGWSG